MATSPATDLGRIARLHYEHNMTHAAIAALLGVSRIKVTRALAHARERGIVEVRVRSESPLFRGEEEEIQRRFGLEGVWIAPSQGSMEQTRESAAIVAARAINKIVGNRTKIAVAQSSALSAALRHLPSSKRNVQVIPITGMLGGQTNGASSLELSMDLARRMGGYATALPAPIHVHSTALAASIRSDPAISRVLKEVVCADLALMAIGSATGSGGLLDHQITTEERRTAVADGAIGNIAAHYVDRRGKPVETVVTKHLITAKFEDIQRIPHRFAIATGAERAKAVQGAFTGGLVTMCALDLDLARAVLALG